MTDVQIDTEVADIIEVLREAQFGWIADEVAARLVEGEATHTESVDGRRRERGTRTQPFSSAEQRRILASAVRRYFIDLPEYWRSAERDMREAMGMHDLNLQVVPSDGVGSIEPVTELPAERRDALEKLVRAVEVAND